MTEVLLVSAGGRVRGWAGGYAQAAGPRPGSSALPLLEWRAG